MKKWILPLFAVLVLCFSVVSIVHTQPVREQHAPPSPPPRTEFLRRVAAVGLVEANSENISMGSHLPGVVAQVHVEVGQKVGRGEPLVSLDVRHLEAQLLEKQASMAVRRAAKQSAEARVRVAGASLNDVQRLLKIAEGTDPRAISAEEVTRRRSAVEIAEANLATAQAEVAASAAEIESAEAGIASVRTDLARSTIVSPIDGEVLQLRIRAGEYAPAGPAADPWLMIGNTEPLHVRVDVDEHEAWRVRQTSRAEAQVRGNSSLVTPLEFVRFEPYVVPKKSLTGDSVERVDTRVLQVVYRVARRDLRLFVGQQMDVFIEATEEGATAQVGRP